MTHPRSSTYSGRIPGAGLVADLVDLIYDAFPGCCSGCESECQSSDSEGPFFDDAAELALDIVKFLRDNGIEVDR